VAVQVGVLFAAVLFLKHMTDSTTIDACKLLLKEEMHQHPETRDAEILNRTDVPEDILVFEIKGPFFFGVADSLNETLRRVDKTPKVFILRMRNVPIIDSTGLRALKQFHARCQQQDILFLLSGIGPKIHPLLRKGGVEKALGKEHLFPHVDAALDYSRKCLSQPRTNPKILLANS
jgi:SulP family sulfate permease